MVALLADPVGQAQAVNNLASAAFAPALVGPLLLYALPALWLVRAPPLAEGAWGRAAGAALAPAQAAAYFFLQAAALMGVALGLPWASYTPAFTLPAMTATGAALCSSASSATCAGAGQVAAGLALLAASGVLALLALLCTLGAAAWMRGVGAAPEAPTRAPPPIASLEFALGAGLLGVVTALPGVVLGYVGSGALLGLIPAGVLAGARAGPSPGGAAAVLGLVCVLVGCASLALAADAQPVVVAGKAPPPPPPAPEAVPPEMAALQQ